MTDGFLPPPREPVPLRRSIVETALLAATGPVVGSLLHANDPSFTSGRFFWPLFGPVVAGLRYGAGHALGGTALLLTFVSVFHGIDDHIGELAAGTFALALVAGEFGDRWHRRLERVERATREDQLRTLRSVRFRRALELSHERLRIETMGRREPLSMALARLESLVRDGADPATLHGAVLRLLAEHADVESARLHPVDAFGSLRPATASYGAGFEAGEHDPVVADALTRRQVGAVDSERDAALGPVLAALPLVDASRRFVALVIVHELPLEAIRPAALTELAILCARLADVLTSTEALSPEVADAPGFAPEPEEGTDAEPLVGRVGT